MELITIVVTATEIVIAFLFRIYHVMISAS